MQYQKQQSQVISNKTLKNVRKNEKKRKKIQIRFQISKRYRKKKCFLFYLPVGNQK